MQILMMFHQWVLVQQLAKFYTVRLTCTVVLATLSHYWASM